MSPIVLKRPQVEQELVDIYAYLGERNVAAAERFLKVAEEAFTFLARFPKAGRPWPSESERLAGVRSWTMPKFRSYRIFYRPIPDGIEVLHLFHAKRDIQRLLDEDEPTD